MDDVAQAVVHRLHMALIYCIIYERAQCDILRVDVNTSTMVRHLGLPNKSFTVIVCYTVQTHGGEPVCSSTQQRRAYSITGIT
jgi:hypothetical protein